MYIARTFLFRLQESPKWLVSSGRSADAVLSLQAIAKLNGYDRGGTIDLADVVDAPPRSGSSDGYRPLAVDETRPLSPSFPKEVVEGKPTMQEQVSVYLDRVSALFRRDMRRTTSLVWLVWFLVSLVYTSFAVFLPAQLELKLGPQSGDHMSALRDYVIFTLAGCVFPLRRPSPLDIVLKADSCPGSLIGAYLIDTPLGYRWSMSGSTFLTAAGILLFAYISSSLAIVLSSAFVSLTGTLMCTCCTLPFVPRVDVRRRAHLRLDAYSLRSATTRNSLWHRIGAQSHRRRPRSPLDRSASRHLAYFAARL